MSYFIHILINTILPLSIMIAIGVVLQKAFRLDIKTLSKLNIYLFSPAVVFVMIYESDITLMVLLDVLLFFCVFFILLFLIVEIVIRIRRYSASMGSSLRNSVLFYNSGNYAVPLNQLVFVNDPFTMSIQVIIMLLQSILPNTYGVYSLNAHKRQLKDTLRSIVYLPQLYVIPIAFLLKGIHVAIPGPIYVPIEHISKGFIAIALVTLGVQLGGMKWEFRIKDVLLSNVLRLAVGPLLALGVVMLLGIEGTMAQALVLSSAVPTSLTSVLIAVEFDSEPEFASQAVFSSTVFSIFTVTLVIYLMQFIP